MKNRIGWIVVMAVALSFSIGILFPGVNTSSYAAVPAPVTIQKPQTNITEGPPFKVGIRSFKVDGGSRPGDIVTIRMVVVASGSSTKPVTWNIYRDKTVIKSETRQNVPTGSTFEATATWQATAGKHTFHGEVDPQNTLKETAAEQRDNISQMVTNVFSDWPAWINGAKQGLREAFPIWNKDAHLVGIVVNGAYATGGRVEYPSNLKSNLSVRMLAAGAPPEVVNNFMGVVADVIQRWANSIRVPGLFWYPYFVQFPGPLGPPMPNTPTPFTALTQDLSTFVPSTMATSIKGRLGETATWPGGATAIDAFCASFFTGLMGAIQNSQVMQVIGSGPIPTFAPPYSPVGPVVNGSAKSVQPLLSSLPAWQ